MQSMIRKPKKAIAAIAAIFVQNGLYNTLSADIPQDAEMRSAVVVLDDREGLR